MLPKHLLVGLPVGIPVAVPIVNVFVEHLQVSGLVVGTQFFQLCL